MRPGRNSHLVNAQNYPSQQVVRNTYTPQQAVMQKQGDDIGENKQSIQIESFGSPSKPKTVMAAEKNQPSKNQLAQKQ